MSINNRLSRLLVGSAVVGLLLTGCGAGPQTPSFDSPGGAPSSSGASQGARNDADVTFAQGMIPHHRQAVEMAGLAAGRSQNPDVLDLAARIGGAQGPEIATMTGWLQEWGAQVPAGAPMGGMEHGSMDQGGMSGMMTPEQMGQLEQATGAAFDRMFLQMMTGHHRGAVAMAGIEVRDGADARATGLAQTIIDTQRGEIAEMERLLAQV